MVLSQLTRCRLHRLATPEEVTEDLKRRAISLNSIFKLTLVRMSQQRLEYPAGLLLDGDLAVTQI